MQAAVPNDIIQRNIILPDVAATERFARAIAAWVRPGDCLALCGDLGAGKTTFARALVNAIAPQHEEVPSPTFTLVQPYDIHIAQGKGVLYHCDLYRLKHASEWAELGVEEAMERAVTLIEWPQIIMDILPANRLLITLAYGDAPESRRVLLEAFGDTGERLSGILND